ncbi:Alpha/Beta hydrolase protein [Mycena maculata]|uniref:Alpha/Beta hydrolase protein n=1 Tax=Mycena maculata TaxID=230809 RepID=A0AAD7HKB0_9AGAR|nr:Alpha/Beta hydrolase protein [Mycena maculata]
MSLLVQLPSGAIEGFVDTSPVALVSAGIDGPLAPSRKWLGIPYASVIERFAPPGPPASWEGVRQCFQFGPACPQPGSPIQELLKAKHNPGSVDRSTIIPTSELDCLNCNVFAPSREYETPVPVMIWIHGGALTTGRSDDFLYDPTQLVRDAESAGNPIIVITLNYRLNFFGWLAHPDLGLQGNFGWHDQLALLRWVQANIGLFNGDKTRVTIFGESAGGASVAGMATRRVENREQLFHRGIMMSGTPFTMAARPPGYSGYAELMALFNITEEIPEARVAALRKIPADDLVASLPKIKNVPKAGWQWVPTVQTDEDSLWPMSSGAAFSQGKWDPAVKELMVGNVQDEGTLFTGKHGVTTHDGLSSFIRHCFPDEALATELAALYPPTPADAPLKASVGAQFVNDQLFDGPALHFATSMSTAKNTQSGDALGIYFYQVRQSFPGLTGNPHLGCHHILDVPLAMRTVSLWPADSAVDKTSKGIAARWAQFAQGAGFPAAEWPLFRDGGEMFCFEDAGETKLESTAEYKTERMRFWIEVYRNGLSRRVLGDLWDNFIDSEQCWPGKLGCFV